MHSKDGIITQQYPDNAEQLMLRERHQVLHSVGMDSVLPLLTASAALVELSQEMAGLKVFTTDKDIHISSTN